MAECKRILTSELAGCISTYKFLLPTGKIEIVQSLADLKEEQIFVAGTMNENRLWLS